MEEIIKIYNEYKASMDQAVNLELFNQYAVVHHSNHIEGSTLTLDETILLLDKNLTPKNKPFQHSQMAIDHYKALKYVIALANEKQSLTIDIIKNIASLVKKNTGSVHRTIAGDIDESKGDWRTVPARAGLSTFKATNIPERVGLLVDEINDSINKQSGFIEANHLAFGAHFQLVSIHPFLDGNGRTSRLLMNFIQQYHNYPLSYIFSDQKSDYYHALVETRRHEDISIFQEFMFNQLNQMMMNEIAELKKSQSVRKDNSSGLSFLF